MHLAYLSSYGPKNEEIELHYLIWTSSMKSVGVFNTAGLRV